MTTIEQNHRTGRLYFEYEGVTYESEDLPREGTYIDVMYAYTGIDDIQYAEVRWSGETPSGMCCTTAREV